MSCSFIQTVQYPRIQLDVHHNPPLHLKLKGVTAAEQPHTEPFIFDLPAKASGAYLIQDAREVVITFNDDSKIRGKALVYDYESGELKHTFECGNQIMDLKVHRDILFVQMYNAWGILAWNWKTGEKVDLPKTWNRIDRMCFSEAFTAHDNFKDPIKSVDKQKPIELIISDSKTLQPINTLSTSLFSIYDTAIKGNSLYVLGVDENASFSNDSFLQSACVIKYDNPTDPNPQKRKISLAYDVNLLATKALKMQQGALFNNKWYPSTNYIWNAETLQPMLIRKTAGDKENACALTQVSQDTAVVLDAKEMEIYKKEHNTFVSKKHIPWEDKDPGTSLELFPFAGQEVIAEGYTSGLIRIRHAEDFNVLLELHPPENMSGVLHTAFHQDYLLAHYLTPSKEGTLAILWDLNTQKPHLLITREALKNRDYQSYNDNIHIVNNDIFVRSENQVMIYKGVFS